MVLPDIPLALPVILFVLALSIAAGRYWYLEPVKAQRFAWRTTRLLVRVLLAPVSAVFITGMFALYLMIALFYFLPRHIATGRKTDITIKLV